MAKKTKDESLDLFYFNEDSNKKQVQKKSKKNPSRVAKKKKSKKDNKIEEENTKDEKFNFDEEIIIGLRRIDEEVDEPKKQKKTKPKSKKKLKQNKSKDNVNEKISNKNEKRRVGNKQASKKVMNQKQSKEQEIARQKRRVIFRVIKWTTLLLIIIGGIIYTLLSPIFNIKTISVIGNSKLSVDEIISLSKIELEQNMFQYKKEEIVQNIKDNAYIDTVKVKRMFPDTIEIVVSEREASFIIQFANAYAFINNQGYILEISNKKTELPILVGTETIQEKIQTGNRLCTEDLEKLGDVLKIIESANSNGLSEFITQIDITDSDDYVLTLQKKKKIIHLGDTSNLSTKMLWILKFNEIEGDTQGEIILNMNLNDEKNKPYFRRKV